jgi:hypothetical protein
LRDRYYVEVERTEIIGTIAGKAATERARKENKLIDQKLQQQRKKWIFIPPSNMTVNMQGVVLSLSQAVGRELLRRRACSIIERDDVTIDYLLAGEYEDAIEAMGLTAE